MLAEALVWCWRLELPCLIVFQFRTNPDKRAINLGNSKLCNGIGFAGHFQTGNGLDYILLRRIYLSTGQLVAGSLQAAY